MLFALFKVCIYVLFVCGASCYTITKEILITGTCIILPSIFILKITVRLYISLIRLNHVIYVRCDKTLPIRNIVMRPIPIDREFNLKPPKKCIIYLTDDAIICISYYYLTSNVLIESARLCSTG